MANSDDCLRTLQTPVLNETQKEFFQYQALEPGQIRLLRLLPTQDDNDFLQIDLVHVSPDTHRYSALSYTWGSPNSVQNVTVKGRKLEIRANLFHFLKRLQRSTEPPEYLWADAICINQKDTAEKSIQVALMSAIFRSAEEVLVWVGEESRDSVFLMNLAKSCREAERTASTGIASLYVAAKQLGTWQAMRAFFQRQYWSRTWIIQEIMLAEKSIQVFCGTDCVNYLDIYGMYNILMMRLELGDLHAVKCRCHTKTVETEAGATEAWYDICERYEVIEVAMEMSNIKIPKPGFYEESSPDPKSNTLLELLWMYTERDCEDARDKIIGLLHIANDIPPGDVARIIDYSRGLHSYFFMVLAMYCRRDLFHMTEMEWMIHGKFEAGTNVVNCGRMLMRSLRVTPASLRQWLLTLNLENVVRDPSPHTICFQKRREPVVELEHICGFGGHATITSVESCSSMLESPVHIFDVVDQYYVARPNMRGITMACSPGDLVFRVVDSEVALVARTTNAGWVPKSWAIIGESSDWKPEAQHFERLQRLAQQPVPDLQDISYSEQPWRTLSMSVNLLVVVSILEGFLQTSDRVRRYRNTSRDRFNSPRRRIRHRRVPVRSRRPGRPQRARKKESPSDVGAWFWRFVVLPNVNISYFANRRIDWSRQIHK